VSIANNISGSSASCGKVDRGILVFTVADIAGGTEAESNESFMYAVLLGWIPRNISTVEINAWRLSTSKVSTPEVTLKILNVEVNVMFTASIALGTVGVDVNDGKAEGLVEEEGLRVGLVGLEEGNSVGSAEGTAVIVEVGGAVDSTVGKGVGESTGTLDGIILGSHVGSMLGLIDGALDGASVGVSVAGGEGLMVDGGVGLLVGLREGLTIVGPPVVGEALGENVGNTEGSLDGRRVGFEEGLAVGLMVGDLLGEPEGSCVALCVGFRVGLRLGFLEGFLVTGELVGLNGQGRMHVNDWVSQTAAGLQQSADDRQPYPPEKTQLE